jgi:hypothetical protein
VWYVEYIGWTRNAYVTLVRKPDEKRLLERLQPRLEDKGFMMGGCGLDLFCSEEGQTVDSWNHCTESLGPIKCWECLP